MNAREGFRRLGLVLGLTGVAGGLIVAYLFGDNLLEERKKHQLFSELLKSPEVQKDLPLYEQYDIQSTEFTKESPSKQGIHKIFYETTNGKHLEVTKFEMEDGRTLYPTDAPSLFSYFELLAFPLVGFILPWGLLKIVVWIGSGFWKP